jgi:hypothetical protein
MATDLKHIKATLDSLRAERFPAVPLELINEILDAEADHQEEGQRKIRLSKVRAAVDAALEE